MSRGSNGSQAGVFNTARPDDLRKAPPWHRLAYLVRKLPEAIERFAPDLNVQPGKRVLDYGCADLPYRRLFPNDVDYVGADLPGNPLASLTIAEDGRLPVDDATFEAVISTQVLEHSDDPSRYLAECYRVLRPGGRLLLSTHGVFVYHPDPVDYWRWTSAGLQRAVEVAGFNVVRFEGVVGLSATGLQLIHDAIYYRAPRILRPLIALTLQSLMSVADRYDARGANGRAYDAMVFILIGEKS